MSTHSLNGLAGSSGGGAVAYRAASVGGHELGGGGFLADGTGGGGYAGRGWSVVDITDDGGAWLAGRRIAPEVGCPVAEAATDSGGFDGPGGLTVGSSGGAGASGSAGAVGGSEEVMCAVVEASVGGDGRDCRMLIIIINCNQRFRAAYSASAVGRLPAAGADCVLPPPSKLLELDQLSDRSPGTSGPSLRVRVAVPGSRSCAVSSLSGGRGDAVCASSSSVLAPLGFSIISLRVDANRPLT